MNERLRLLELKRKYEQMLRMRLHDEAHPGENPRHEMAALAAHFPGALRELDELPLEVIRTRVRTLARCLDSGAATEPWMVAMSEYHRLARGALAAKSWLAGRKRIDSETSAAFRKHFLASPDQPDAIEWATDLERVARPPKGKLTALVFERVAKCLRLSVGETRVLVLGAPRSRQSLDE